MKCMKIIKITKKEYGSLNKLITEYDRIYGDPKITVWDIDDLEELRKIGEKFIRIFEKYL